MKWIAASIVILAIVALVVGLRATEHHKAQPCGSPFTQPCP